MNIVKNYLYKKFRYQWIKISFELTYIIFLFHFHEGPTIVHQKSRMLSDKILQHNYPLITNFQIIF